MDREQQKRTELFLMDCSYLNNNLVSKTSVILKKIGQSYALNI